MSYIIGIDPGKSGAMAILGGSKKKKLIGLQSMPLQPIPNAENFALDENAMCTFLLNARYQAKENGQDIYAIIEQQHAFPKQGKSANFGSGFGYGLWLGMLRVLHIPVHPITSMSWRAKIFTEEERSAHSKDAFTKGKKRQLTNKEATEIRRIRKRLSIAKARALYPACCDRVVGDADDGKAEAILIAHTGRIGRLYDKAKL